MNRLDDYSKKFIKKHIPEFEIGDTIDVIVLIMEGEKERKQTFTGTVIGRKGSGLNETFTVRRLVQGEGVERIFSLHSSKVTTIKVKRKGRVRRAKLYYLRDRVGKATKVKERIWNAKDAKISAQQSEDAAKEAAEMNKSKKVEAKAK